MKFAFTIAATLLAALATATPSLRSALAPAAASGCEMMCLAIYDPVCGSDGKTYSNECQLNLADCNNRYKNPSAKAITVAAPGKCEQEADAIRCPRACTKIMMPVCGSNGVTYNNECEFNNAKCTLKIASWALTMTPGECPPADNAVAPTPAPSTLRKCAQMCTADYAPVCGSDGQTYSNKCVFNVAKCNLGPKGTLTMVSEGACKTVGASDARAEDAVACPRGCPKIMMPVCGSDGQTYSNKCFFNVAKCNLGSNGTLTMVSEGACKTVGASDAQADDAVACPHGCPKIMMPVCGSDGVTYNNECEFENAKCTLKIAGWAMTFTPGACA